MFTSKRLTTLNNCRERERERNKFIFYGLFLIEKKNSSKNSCKSELYEIKIFRNFQLIDDIIENSKNWFDIIKQ